MGWGAEVDEAWALEKCSVTGARPVHLVVQLLYGSLWANRTLHSRMKKKQKTRGLPLRSETRCCLMPPSITPTYGARGREQWERGGKTWTGVRAPCPFLHRQVPRSSAFVGQPPFPWKWLLSAGENLQIKRMEMSIPALSPLGRSLYSDPLSSARAPFCPWQRQDPRRDCRALRALTASSLLNPRFYQCSSLAGSLICHLMLHKYAIIRNSTKLCRGF